MSRLRFRKVAVAGEDYNQWLGLSSARWISKPRGGTHARTGSSDCCENKDKMGEAVKEEGLGKRLKRLVSGLDDRDLEERAVKGIRALIEQPKSLGDLKLIAKELLSGDVPSPLTVKGGNEGGEGVVF